MYYRTNIKAFLVFLALCSSVFATVSAQQSKSSEQDALTLIDSLYEMFPVGSSSTKLMGMSMLTRNGQRVYVDVSGMSIVQGRNLAKKLESALIAGNSEELLRLIREHGLSIDLEYTTDDTLMFVSDPPETVEDRLYQAVITSSYDEVERIIQQESPDVDKEVLKRNAVIAFTPMYVAATNADTRMVKLLLKHGASPNKLTDKGAPPPIGGPIINENLELTRVLLDAGASLDIRIGPLDRNPPAVVASELNSMELLELFLEYGADLSKSGINGWTALSDSLWRNQFDMAEFLIPHSNPMKSTYAEKPSSSSRDLGYEWFPGGNALFHARRFAGNKAEHLSSLIAQRAEALAGEQGRWYLEMHALFSEAEMSLAENRPLESLQLLEQANSVTDLKAMNPSGDKALLKHCMLLLSRLHETSLIAGKEFQENYRSQVQHFDNMGGKNREWHDVLDILYKATENDVEAELKVWEGKYGKPKYKQWKFTRLKTWIENEADIEKQARLIAVVDFFQSSH